MTITLHDIAVANGSDAIVGLIDETSKAHPEVTGMVQVGTEVRTIPNVGASRTIEGLNYKTLVRVGLPTVGFRAANQGVAPTKSQHENRQFETFICNPRWQADKAAADRYEDGAASYLAMEASSHMEAAMQLLSKQFYYGAASPGDLLGHPGLVNAVTSSMIVSATGTTPNAATSVWAVKWGLKDVIWLWGNNGQLELSDVDERDAEDAEGKKFTAYHQELTAYPGLQVGSTRSIGRICNITNEAGKTLTDDLISDLLSTFEEGVVPDVLFMNRRALSQLQKSRTATNSTGAPAPFPTESFGIPIALTGGILNTEAIVT